MNDELLEQITDSILQRLNSRAPAALLIGKAPVQDTGYRYTDHAPYDAVVIGSLSAAELLHFSNPSVIHALLSGLPVFLNEDGLEHRAYKATANRVLWTQLNEQEKKLRQMGVQLLSAMQGHRVIAAEEARQLRRLHHKPPTGAVLTPLARDILEGVAP